MAVRVFISYSHDSPEHMDRVLALANRLRADGVDCIVDRYQQSPAEGWPRWTLRQLEKADFILVVCSEIYKRRLAGEEPAGVGRGAKWEGAIITQGLYDRESTTTRFVPILPPGADTTCVPIILSGQQHYRPFTPEGDLDSAGYEQLYRLLTDQAAVAKPDLGPVKPMPELAPVTDFGVGAAPAAAAPRRHSGGEGDVARRPARSGRKLWIGLGVAALVAAAALYWALPAREVETPPSRPVFEYSYFKELPYSLFHSIAANEEQIYWLKLAVGNPLEQPLSVRVTCEAYPDELGKRWALCSQQEERVRGKVASYTVGSGERRIKTLNPRLRLLVGDNFPQPKPLHIEWTIFEGRAEDAATIVHESGRPNEQRLLGAETVQINLAPKSRFYFDLADTVIAGGEEREGRAVDRELLLASLAAWTKIDPGSETAESVAREAASLPALVRSVYEGLFQGAPGLAVSRGVPPFPPKPYELIRPAKALWSDGSGSANPLEAALLLGNLARRQPPFRDRLVLVWPGAGSGAASSLFVAWRGGAEWQAIDLAASATPYELNLEQSSFQVSALLSDGANESLRSRGVHLEADLELAAIDFVQAARQFKIEGLP